MSTSLRTHLQGHSDAGHGIVEHNSKDLNFEGSLPQYAAFDVLPPPYESLKNDVPPPYAVIEALKNTEVQCSPNLNFTTRHHQTVTGTVVSGSSTGFSSSSPDIPKPSWRADCCGEKCETLYHLLKYASGIVLTIIFIVLFLYVFLEW